MKPHREPPPAGSHFTHSAYHLPCGLVARVIASMLLAPLGARLAHRVPARTLRRAFAATMFLLALRMAWSLARG